MFQILGKRSNVKRVKLYANGKGLSWVSQLVRFLTYKHEGGKHSLIYKTVGQLLDETAKLYPSRLACVSVYENKRMTFQEVKEKSDQLAAGLLVHGVEKGDRVGIWAQNSLDWYITNFALMKAGAISVYINPAYQATEIKHCLNKVGVKVLFMAEKFKKQDYPKILSEIYPEFSSSKPGELHSRELPSLKKVVCFSNNNVPGTIPFESLFEEANEKTYEKLKEMEKTLTPDDPSNIQFTSGTTGSPKGAVLTHFHVINNSRFFGFRQNIFEKEHIMCLMGPLFHAMGSVIGVLTCLNTGSPLVIPDGSFSASKAAEAIMEEKCTILLGTPTMYIDILKHIQDHKLKLTTPEVAITGGAYAPAQLFSDIISLVGVKRVASVYGLTETGPISFASKPDDVREKMMTTVGYVMDHTEVKVVDERGFQVAWDKPGELWVRGYNIMNGYWDDKEKTKEAITEDNWFKTGDQFSLSEDGYGKVVGRIKDIIIRGGENIYPSDVEEFLMTHPDVLDAQAIGVPDKRLGEKVCACLRLKPGSNLTEEDVKNFCKGKIAAFKIPEYVYFLDTFPKTSSGKVLKFRLREEAKKHFKIKDEADQ